MIDRIGELVDEPSQTKNGLENDLSAPQQSVPFPASTNERLIDRHLDFLGASMVTIRRALKKSDTVDMHVLTSYQGKIRSLEGELQGLKEQILSLEDIGELVLGQSILM